MGFAALRSIVRPLARTLLSRTTTTTTTIIFPATIPSPKPDLSFFISSFHQNSSWLSPSVSNPFRSLTDTRKPKQKPSLTSRKKRAQIRTPGPHVWIKNVPEGSTVPNQPTQKAIKRRNEKKRMRQKKEFIKCEVKKRKLQFQEAKKRKAIERVERKMAAVARERAWAVRLEELQRIEAEKKKATA